MYLKSNSNGFYAALVVKLKRLLLLTAGLLLSACSSVPLIEMPNVQEQSPVLVNGDLYQSIYVSEIVGRPDNGPVPVGRYAWGESCSFDKEFYFGGLSHRKDMRLEKIAANTLAESGYPALKNTKSFFDQRAEVIEQEALYGFYLPSQLEKIENKAYKEAEFILEGRLSEMRINLCVYNGAEKGELYYKFDWTLRNRDSSIVKQLSSQGMSRLDNFSDEPGNSLSSTAFKSVVIDLANQQSFKDALLQ